MGGKGAEWGLALGAIPFAVKKYPQAKHRDFT